MAASDFNFDRRTGIGASRAPVICGVAPPTWGSPLGEYLWMTGELPDGDASPQMLLGSDLEVGIRAAVERIIGNRIIKPGTQRHVSIPWMYASPDGQLVDGEQPTAIGVEIKNVGPRYAKEWGESGTDEVPDYVLIQVHHQAAVFLFHTVIVAALICGGEVRIYPIKINLVLCSKIVGILSDFWDKVQRRDPPEPTWGNDRTSALLNILHPPKTGVQCVLYDDAALKLVNNYECFKQIIDGAEHFREECKARLIGMMGDASEAILPDGTIVKRQIIESNGYTVQPKSYVKFSIKMKGKRHGNSNSSKLLTAAINELNADGGD